jgi:hypothetical protein
VNFLCPYGIFPASFSRLATSCHSDSPFLISCYQQNVGEGACLNLIRHSRVFMNRSNPQAELRANLPQTLASSS